MFYHPKNYYDLVTEVLDIAAFTTLMIKECGHGIYNNYGNNFQHNVKKRPIYSNV